MFPCIFYFLIYYGYISSFLFFLLYILLMLESMGDPYSFVQLLISAWTAASTCVVDAAILGGPLLFGTRTGCWIQRFGGLPSHSPFAFFFTASPGALLAFNLPNTSCFRIQALSILDTWPSQQILMPLSTVSIVVVLAWCSISTFVTCCHHWMSKMCWGGSLMEHWMWRAKVGHVSDPHRREGRTIALLDGELGR